MPGKQSWAPEGHLTDRNTPDRDRAIGVLPSASFGRVVERERRTARRDARDLSLCIFEARDARGERQLERLGGVFARAVPEGHVGWLGERRLCILVDGARAAADHMARRVSRLNDALAGPALDASVWVYAHEEGPQAARWGTDPMRAPEDADVLGASAGSGLRGVFAPQRPQPRPADAAELDGTSRVARDNDSHWSLPLCW